MTRELGLGLGLGLGSKSHLGGNFDDKDNTFLVDSWVYVPVPVDLVLLLLGSKPFLNDSKISIL